MKKYILTIVLATVVSIGFGQALQKGNLMGLHISTINLNPDVTMNQYKDLFMKTAIPEYEKNFSGMKVFMVKGIRGENENSFGWLFLFGSEQDRDKYFNPDGNLNEAGKLAVGKLQPTLDKLNKLGTVSTKYTDWVIQ